MSFSLDGLILPASDGSEVSIFDRNGRHRHTMDALTGVVRYLLSYDGTGRLVDVSDGDGNVTAIERHASGNPVVLIGDSWAALVWKWTGHRKRGALGALQRHRALPLLPLLWGRRKARHDRRCWFSQKRAEKPSYRECLQARAIANLLLVP